jgi:signal transduction histidine kinase
MKDPASALDNIALDHQVDLSPSTTKLSKRNAPFSLLFHHVSEAICLVRLEPSGEMVLENFNDRFIETNHRYGIKINREDLVGQSVAQYFRHYLHLSEPEIEVKMQRYSSCILQRKPVKFREQTRFETFGEVISETVLAPLYDEKEKVSHILYLTRDLTESQLAAQQIHEKNRLLTQVQKMAHLGVWQWNTTTDKSLWSEEMFQIFRLREPKAPSLDEWMQFTHPNDRRKLLMAIEQSVLDHLPFELEYRAKLGEEIKFLRIWGDLIVSEQKEVRQIYGLCQDITAQVAAKDRMLNAVMEAEDRARSGIARDLHDGLGQQLTIVSLNLSALQQEKHRLSGELQKRLDLATEMLNQAMKESRNIAHSLMPLAVKEFGYVQAVSNLLNGLKDSGIKVQFVQNLEGERLPERWEFNLYRITQEAIQNSIRHAGATAVTIQVIKHPKQLIFSIEDNGRGFHRRDPEYSAGLGIHSMRTRAEAMHGEFFLDSHPQRGTIITIELPFNQA